MKINSTTKLLNQLTHFGLNPKQWTLCRLSKNKYVIRNQADKNYYYIGRTDTKVSQPQWAKLTLLSI